MASPPPGWMVRIASMTRVWILGMALVVAIVAFGCVGAGQSDRRGAVDFAREQPGPADRDLDDD